MGESTKFIIKKDGEYADRRIVEKIVNNYEDEETGEALTSEIIKISFTRKDFNLLLNLIGTEAIYWTNMGTSPEDIGLEVIDRMEEEFRIDLTPDDI